jgi:hypothetical protein
LTFFFAVVAAPAGELPVNTWTKLSEGGIGPKFSPAMVYSPMLKRFVLVGGAIGRYPKGGPFPYDVLSAAPGKGEWRNEFPEGSGWKPEVGPARVPAWKGYRFSTKDEKGNVRPHMRHTRMFYQYCLDTDANCVWAIIADRTMRLDLATRKWEDLGRFPAGGKEPAKGTPRGLMWAATCYDPVNKEVVLFGGAHKQPQAEGVTWLFSTEKRGWRKLEKKDPVRDPLRAEAVTLRDRIKDLVAAVRNRLYKTELPAAAKVDVQAELKKLLAEVKAFAVKLEKANVGKGLDRGAIAGAGAVAAKGITAEDLLPLTELQRLLAGAADALSVQPPPRIMAPMAYDPKARKIVMFGGDRWTRMNCETWVYDCKTRSWARRLPATSPSPRAGHALVYLPKSGKFLLFGGYVYRTSMSYCTSLYQPARPDMWTYDVAGNEWLQLKAAGDKGPALGCSRRAPVAAAAASSEEDVVQVIGLGKKLSTWAISVSPGSGTSKGGNKPGAELRRGLCFDPAWFDESLGKTKPGEAEARLKSLPVNKWVGLPVPKRLFNRDWGTQVFDFHRDQILHWSGGHSAYCGTAPAHYSVKLGCWSTGVPAAIPMEHCYSAGVAATSPASTFSGRPFAPHTYKSYCYDFRTKKMVWLHGRTWIYDPDRRDWEPDPKQPPFLAERHTTVACATPHGVAAWAVPAGKSVYAGWRGLWLLTDTDKGEWKTLVKAGKSGIFPIAYGDRHGMCYDSKRDRLYMFNFGLKDKYKVCAWDFKDSKAEIVEPEGSRSFPMGASVGREPVYMPDHDLVFIASGVKGKAPATLFFDPGKKAWLGMDPKFDKNKRGRAVRPGHGVGTGVMWDPGRKLLWASDSRGPVFVMKFDRKTAGLTSLKP